MCVQSSSGFTQCIVGTQRGKAGISAVLSVRSADWKESPQCRKSRVIWQLNREYSNSQQFRYTWNTLLDFKTFLFTGFWRSRTNRNSKVNTFPCCCSSQSSEHGPIANIYMPRLWLWIKVHLHGTFGSRYQASGRIPGWIFKHSSW